MCFWYAGIARSVLRQQCVISVFKYVAVADSCGLWRVYWLPWWSGYHVCRYSLLLLWFYCEVVMYSAVYVLNLSCSRAVSNWLSACFASPTSLTILFILYEKSWQNSDEVILVMISRYRWVEKMVTWQIFCYNYVETVQDSGVVIIEH